MKRIFLFCVLVCQLCLWGILSAQAGEGDFESELSVIKAQMAAMHAKLNAL